MLAPRKLPRWRYARPHRRLSVFLLLSAAICSLVVCNRAPSPQLAYDHARRTFIHGDLMVSQEEAEQGYERFRSSNPEWAWKFRTLEAEILLWRGKYPGVLTLLDHPSSMSLPPDVNIQILTLAGIAHARQLLVDKAEQELDYAEKLCSGSSQPSCGALFQGRGLVALGRNQFSRARSFLERSLAFSRADRNRFLEATSLLNLGAVSLKEGYFDEAVDFSDEANQVSTALEAKDISQVALLNVGWAYFRMGDSEKALELSLESENRARQLGDSFNLENGLTNAGYVYMQGQGLDRAEESFRQALELSQSENSKEHMLNALRVLARLSLQTGDLDKAADYAHRALQIAHEGNNHPDELYPLLVEGQVAARRGDAAKARQVFETVEQDPDCPVSLKWEAQHSLARLYEDEKQANPADLEYRAALTTFEAARATVKREDFQLSFLTNASRIYDDYVHFLVAQGKTDEALRWADYSRARTLLEGLGVLSKGPSKASHAGPPPLNSREISRRAKGVLLFYWLGEKQSYLWAITPQKTSLFPLPPGAEIEALVQRYRNALKGPQDVLESSEDGRALYRTLIAPAKALLGQREGLHHSRRQPQQPEFRDLDRRRPQAPLLDRRCRRGERQFAARARGVFRQKE